MSETTESNPQAGVAVTSGRARIVQINVSRGGVPKTPVAEAVITRLGIQGDEHDDVHNHGGPDRALCLYTLEQIETLRREGHDIAPGCLGENLTLRGIDLAALVPGTHLRLGSEVEIEVTGYAGPCRTIARWFSDGRFGRISEKTHPGESRVYARVLRTGVLRPGDAATLIGANVDGE